MKDHMLYLSNDCCKISASAVRQPTLQCTPFHLCTVLMTDASSLTSTCIFRVSLNVDLQLSSPKTRRQGVRDRGSVLCRGNFDKTVVCTILPLSSHFHPFAPVPSTKTLMCKTCCSHASLQLTSPHLCLHPNQSPSTTPTYHVGFFSMQTHGILFPGEHVLLDVYIASSLRLLSDIQTTGLISTHHPPSPTWESHSNHHLLPHSFAIAPSPSAPYGALAIFDSESTSTTQLTYFTRFRARIVARYQLAEQPHIHAAYPCLSVHLLCDIPHRSLPLPLDRVFPPLSPRSAIHRRQSPGVRTRAAAAALQSAQPRRSFACMGGLSYTHWRANLPDRLLMRARTAARFARLNLDRLLVDHPPEHSACPTQWSFWLCAVLPPETDPCVLLELLGCTSVIERLRTLIELFEEMPKKTTVRRQLRGGSIHDKAYRCRPARKRVRKATEEQGASSEGGEGKTDGDQRKTHVVRTELDEFLKENPWPCSPQKGFQCVDLKTPCKGWFRLVQPASHDSTEPKLAV